MTPPIYWRWRILSAILFSLIFFHILNRQSGSKGWNLSRHRLIVMLVQAEKEICFLHKSCVFKLQIPIDRHSPILIPGQCYLSDPPHFSLPSTFKGFLQKIISIRMANLSKSEPFFKKGDFLDFFFLCFVFQRESCIGWVQLVRILFCYQKLFFITTNYKLQIT